MFKYITVFVLNLCSFISSTSQASFSVDAQDLQRRPVQTRNNKGMNFPSLGDFEEDFISQVRLLDLEEGCNGRVLLLGDGYGFMSLRALNSSMNCEIFTNDLSNENLSHLKTSIQKLKSDKEPNNQNKTDRIFLVPGDCLVLPTNQNFLNSMREVTSFSTFHAIMGANLIHFFDGSEILKFFLNSYNMLVPNGCLYVMNNTKPRQTRETKALANGGGDVKLYIDTLLTIRDLAEKEGILFPGYIDESLLVKSKTLKKILYSKPNGISVSHLLDEKELLLVAQAIGFKILSCKYYAHVLTTSGISMKENPDHGNFVGMVFQKPAEGTDTYKMMDQLDIEFVTKCQGSKEDMRSFIKMKLAFSDSYPFVNKM